MKVAIISFLALFGYIFFIEVSLLTFRLWYPKRKYEKHLSDFRRTNSHSNIYTLSIIWPVIIIGWIARMFYLLPAKLANFCFLKVKTIKEPSFQKKSVKRKRDDQKKQYEY